MSPDSSRHRIGSADVLAGFKELRDYITACRPREIAFERPARGRENTNCSFAQLSSSSNAHRAPVLQQDSCLLRIERVRGLIVAPGQPGTNRWPSCQILRVRIRGGRVCAPLLHRGAVLPNLAEPLEKGQERRGHRDRGVVWRTAQWSLRP
jgi:hypothetical protein